MVFNIPQPVLLVLSAAVQGMALVFGPPLLFHAGRLNLTLTAAFIYMTILNLLLWAVYIVFIYPDFVSPLRHLPCPQVRVEVVVPLSLLSIFP